MRTVRSAQGLELPVLGLGTWGLGEDAARRAEEVRAVRAAFDAGIVLIDTAEMYGDGAAEEVVAEAIQGRDEVVLVSKVLPQNASRRGAIAACEASLRRLRREYVDLYLLHWEGRHPLADTLVAFAQLQGQGKIRHYGVSNFDAPALAKALALEGGKGIACNQVLYNLMARNVEVDLLPLCERRRLPVMAYSPLEQGKLLRAPAVAAVARRRGVSAARVCLAWLLRRPGTVAIPKSAHPDRVRDFAGALDLALGPEDLAELEAAFPAPDEPGELPTH